jgi:hypothetical protein
MEAEVSDYSSEDKKSQRPQSRYAPKGGKAEGRLEPKQRGGVGTFWTLAC